jgi:signal transduction histidine kinase
LTIVQDNNFLRVKQLKIISIVIAVYSGLPAIATYLGYLPDPGIHNHIRFTYALTHLLIYFVIRKGTHNYLPFLQIIVVASLIEFTSVVINAQHIVFGVFWYLMVIFVAYFIGDKKTGILTSITSILLIITMLNMELLVLNKISTTSLFVMFFVFITLSHYYSSMLNSREEMLRVSNEELNLIKENLEKEVRIQVLENIEKERELINASKFSQMGEMLQSITHQWRQPLSAISSRLIKHKIQIDVNKSIEIDELNQTINEIEEQIAYLTNTISDFQTYFHKLPNQNYSINDTLALAIRLVESLYKSSNIDIVFKPSGNYYSYGKQSLLAQVILIMLQNAKDAIVANKPLIKTITLRVYDEDGWAIIEVQDYAGGIDKSIIENVFDAYFTTKTKNEGSGIGLDLAKAIVEKSGGSISVKNVNDSWDELITGACFRIKLKLSSSH